MEKRNYNTIIIGAGPAGLSVSKCLKDRGIEHIVLEKGERIAMSWRNFYDSLTLHTGKHLSTLPGLSYSKETPLFPSKDQFIAYMEEYAKHFKLPILYNENVVKIKKDGNWHIDTESGVYECTNIVLAIGIASSPWSANISELNNFKNKIIHSIEYKNPEQLEGKRVLIVGAGNSAAEIACELCNHDIETTIYIRNGVNIAPLKMLGIPLQYISFAIDKLPYLIKLFLVKSMAIVSDLFDRPPIPRPSYTVLDRPPIIGKKFSALIKEGKIDYVNSIDKVEEDRITFNNKIKNIDVIILATGFKMNLDLFDRPPRLDSKGFAERKKRVVDKRFNDLFYIGHNYSSIGGIPNMYKDSKIIANLITQQLRG